MSQARELHDRLAAELDRRLAAIVGPQEMIVPEPPILADERRRAKRVVKARRRVLLWVVVWLGSMLVAIETVVSMRSASSNYWATFWAAWGIAAVAAAASGMIVLFNWFFLPRLTAVIGLVPWAIVSLVSTIAIVNILR